MPYQLILFNLRAMTKYSFAEGFKAGRCHPAFMEVRRSGATNTRVRELALSPRHKEHTTFIVKEYEQSEDWQSGDRAYRIMTAIHYNGFDKGGMVMPSMWNDSCIGLSG